MEPDETRAAVARRRLAQLVASFEAGLPEADAPVGGGTVDERRAGGHGDSGHGDSERAHRDAERPPAHRRLRLTASHASVMAALAAAAMVVLVWVVLSGRPDTTAAPPERATPVVSQQQDSDGQDADPLVIDVQGHVNRPGIVTLPQGSRVHDAVEAAGGLSGPVEATSINMARELADGEQLLVGLQPPPGAPGESGPAGHGSGPVNLNHATEAELLELPGIGPVTAAAIVAWREKNGNFTSVDDLLEVRGIGEARLAELRDAVTV